MRHLIVIPLAGLLTAAAATTQDAPSERVEAPPERAYSAFSDDKHRQFDFWIGVWDVILRIQQPDLSFQDSVRSRASIYSILDGKAILELWDSEPIKGYSLRYYDPDKQKWMLWLDWPSANRANKSSLEGEFRHGRGDFHTGFTDSEGNEVRGRYSFNDITPFSLRWDDLWSKDGGKSWSKNWRMEWTRREVDPEWPIHSARVPTFDDGSRCDEPAFRPYEVLVGPWKAAEARLDAYRVLDGCALMAFLESGPTKEFWIFTWVGAKSRWEVDVLDEGRDSPLVSYSSTESWSAMASPMGEEISFTIDAETLVYRRGDRRLELHRP